MEFYKNTFKCIFDERNWGNFYFENFIIACKNLTSTKIKLYYNRIESHKAMILLQEDLFIIGFMAMIVPYDGWQKQEKISTTISILVDEK